MKLLDNGPRWRWCSLLVSATLGFLCVPFSCAVAAIPSGVSAVTESPAIERIAPSSGPKSGGTAVMIQGSGFEQIERVFFGPVEALDFSVESDTEIVAISPAGEMTVAVIVEGRDGVSQPASQGEFVYGPEISSLSPSAGSPAGGTTTEIQGFNLAGASAVRFGSSEAMSFTVNSAESITATAPPLFGRSATVPVVVETPEGASVAPDRPDLLPPDFFIYGPEVDSVEPSVGPTSGGTLVVIRGKGFAAASWPSLAPPFVRAVMFGSMSLACQGSPPPWMAQCGPVNFWVVSDSEILAISPPGSGSVPIGVVSGGGASATGSGDPIFSYRTDSISPTSPSPSAQGQKARTMKISCRPARRLDLDKECVSSIGTSEQTVRRGSGGIAARIVRDGRIYASGTAWFNGSRVSVGLEATAILRPGKYRLAIAAASSKGAPLRFTIALR